MKYILVVMLVLIGKSILGSIKNLFKSEEKLISKSENLIDEALKDMANKSNLSDSEKLINELKSKLKLDIIDSSRDDIKNKQMLTGVFCVVAICIAIYRTLLYVLSSIYMQSLVLTVVAAILIIRVWQSMFKAIQWMQERDNSKLKEGFVGKMFDIVYLGYIGYLIYFLIITW